MPNGNMTTKEYLIQINQKLDDFIERYQDDKNDHGKEHALMWKLIIGLPSFLIVVFTLIKMLGG